MLIIYNKCRSYIKFCGKHYYDHLRGLPPDTKNFLIYDDNNSSKFSNDSVEHEENNNLLVHKNK